MKLSDYSKVHVGLRPIRTLEYILP